MGEGFFPNRPFKPLVQGSSPCTLTFCLNPWLVAALVGGNEAGQDEFISLVVLKYRM